MIFIFAIKVMIALVTVAMMEFSMSLMSAMVEVVRYDPCCLLVLVCLRGLRR